MKSHEILRDTIEVVGAKQVAFDLRVSTSLVYKWCSDAGAPGDFDTTGARNPLDRVHELCRSTRSSAPVEWLCAQVGGYFVENPGVEADEIDGEFLAHTHQLVSRFSKLLAVISESIANEGRIDPAEAEEIRSQWRELQSHGEAFVRGCETGLFDPERPL